MIYSYSRLSTYRGEFSCPWKFYLKYIRKLPETPTPALALGKAAHAVIAATIKHKTDNPYPFCEAVGTACEINPDELYRLVDHPAVRRATEKAECIEEHFEMPLAEEIVFQGYIDCYWKTDDRIVLIDWKTNQQPYRATDTHQLGLYAAYLSQQYSLPVEGHLVFLRTRKIESHQYSPEDIRESLDWATETAQEIERLLTLETENPVQVFAPKPGKACEFCAYAHLCPEAEVPEVITNAADAQNYAAEILKLEARLKQMKEILRNWVEAHGTVEAGGKEFYLQESYYWKWGDEAQARAVELMLAQGLDPCKILRLTAESLRKLGWDDEQVAVLGAQKVVTQRFDCRKIK